MPALPRHSAGGAGSALSPPKLIHMYDEFITKNSGQVSQIESALRSLTYIIPGRFRDAEIASETLHSGVQLLSLYHDNLLSRAASTISRGPGIKRPPSPHTRYTRYWTQRSGLYRRIALLLQMVRYTELLVEMAANRRGGENGRWRVVVLLEFIKAVCRLLLLRITSSRPILSPSTSATSPSSVASSTKSAHEREWVMPRTGMSLPSLPTASDITSYLLSRVLTPDDIKPATKLLNQLRGSGQAAEVLHILAPLVYATCLALSKASSPEARRRAWGPWLAGFAVEYAARQLRDKGLRTTALERDEWRRRGWSMGWWAMRGPFYESVVKGVVEGVRKRVPGVIGGILEDYEYLWENYYFSTSD
ncbi:unnamed protein product [Parascedosporium putredinis]|uniref:Peroxisomal membrane protein PEX16 n=1 Tax=Parascedosporium putredinis TaxID=1442378 RepID=A0A9P1H0B1_9PEZI|nr:unnamed protein product [Parascedosporium putredinis]CAI7993713.1 unnamed protein product [Parascedosporium putredinis]